MPRPKRQPAPPTDLTDADADDTVRCKFCGEPIYEGQVYDTTRRGRAYHLTCRTARAGVDPHHELPDCSRIVCVLCEESLGDEPVEMLGEPEDNASAHRRCYGRLDESAAHLTDDQRKHLEHFAFDPTSGLAEIIDHATDTRCLQPTTDAEFCPCCAARQRDREAEIVGAYENLQAAKAERAGRVSPPDSPK